MSFIFSTDKPKELSEYLPALYVALLVIGLWVPYGLAVFPINDGWVALTGDPHFHGLKFFTSARREFRAIPLMLAHLSNGHTLELMNLELMTLDIFIFLGLYKLLTEIFPDQKTEAVAAASLGLLFANDPTMLWLGAFGVNVSWGLMLWASVCVIRSHDRGRRDYLWLGLILLYTGARTYPGYIAFPVLMVLYFFYTRRLRATTKLLSTARYLGAIVLTLVIAIIPTMLAAIHGQARVGHVASFNQASALSSFADQAIYLAYGWIEGISDRVGGDLWSWGSYSTLVAATLFLVWKSDMRESVVAEEPCDTGWSATLGMILLAIGLFVFGFLPYALSDVRTGHGRQLIVARFGLVLLFIYAPPMVAPKRLRRISRMVIATLAAVAIVMFVQNKAWMFHERVRGSQRQELMMAEMLRELPCISSGQSIVIEFTSDELVHTPGGSMLLNRPRYLFRYFYGRGDYQVVGVNNVLLRHE
ncbi:MAG: hypothetical protein WBW88_10065, partial [Rhodothermales bacterium]